MDMLILKEETQDPFSVEEVCYWEAQSGSVYCKSSCKKKVTKAIRLANRDWRVSVNAKRVDTVRRKAKYNTFSENCASEITLDVRFILHTETNINPKRSSNWDSLKKFRSFF